MKKSYLWRKMTSGLMAAAVTVTAMPGLGLTMVQAEEKKTLKVAMECSYAPYNWTQPDDSNGAVPISGSSDYAYGYDVMMAKKICDELGYDLEIVKLDWDSLVPAVQSGKVDCVIAGQSITSERQQMVDFRAILLCIHYYPGKKRRRLCRCKKCGRSEGRYLYFPAEHYLV